MRIMNGQFPSIEQATEKYTRPASGRAEANGRRTFADILSDKKLEKEGTELKFSKHASHRLSDRNIELSDSQMERLSEGTQMAGRKGINESLVIMDELAFIVNVRNNTVITAMDQNEAGENVFTNIDGAVIV